MLKIFTRKGMRTMAFVLLTALALDLLLAELFHSAAFLVAILAADALIVLLFELLFRYDVVVAVGDVALELVVVLGQIDGTRTRIDDAGVAGALTRLALRFLFALCA